MLEAQAVGPIENPIKHGTTHDDAVAAIEAVEGYRVQSERIFGPISVGIDNIGKAIVRPLSGLLSPGQRRSIISSS